MVMTITGWVSSAVVVDDNTLIYSQPGVHTCLLVVALLVVLCVAVVTADDCGSLQDEYYHAFSGVWQWTASCPREAIQSNMMPYCLLPFHPGRDGASNKLAVIWCRGPYCRYHSLDEK